MAPDGTRPARFEGHEFPQLLPEPDDTGEYGMTLTPPRAVERAVTR